MTQEKEMQKDTAVACYACGSIEDIDTYAIYLRKGVDLRLTLCFLCAYELIEDLNSSTRRKERPMPYD